MNVTRLVLNNLQALVVDLSEAPHRIVPWERAFTQAYKGKVDVLASYAATVASEGVRLELPSVVKLRRKLPKVRGNALRFNPANVYLRDGYKCVYCPRPVMLPPSKLTRDHVIPKSRWTGPPELMTDWENVVTACWECNQKKRNRTPEEAGMALRHRPIKPASLPTWRPFFVPENAPESWAPWLEGLPGAEVRRAG